MNWSYRNVVLVCSTLAFFATVSARLVISPVVPAIVDSFSVTNSAVGLALTGMWGAYALTQFPSGVLGDRIGEREIILMSVGGTAIVSTLLALSPSFLIFAVLVLALGVTAGLHYITATSLLTRQFDQTGRAIGYHITGAPLAGLVAPALAGVVGSQFGWRPAVFIGTVFAVPTFLLFASRVRPMEPRFPETPMRERVELGLLREILSRGPILYTTALSVLGAFTWQATASFLPAFLVAAHGHSPMLAGILFSVYFFIHGALQPFMGSLSDRFSRDAVAATTMTVGIVGYGTLVVSTWFPATVVAIIAVGIAMTWGAPLQSRFIDVLRADEQGAGFGLVRTTYMLLGASGSVAVGTAADVFGWNPAFGMLAGVMALGLTVIVANRLLGLGY